MATYLTLNALFLMSTVIAIVAFRPTGLRPKPMLATLALLLILTAVFDNAIIGTGIVAYNNLRILGINLGIAPIEDFAYALSAVLLVPFIFEKLRKHHD